MKEHHYLRFQMLFDLYVLERHFSLETKKKGQNVQKHGKYIVSYLQSQNRLHTALQNLRHLLCLRQEERHLGA